MATITPTITAEQLYTNGGGVTTNYSGYVGYGGSVSNKLYSCRLAFSPTKSCSKISLSISAKSNGYITSSNVNFRAAVYTSKKYPNSATWDGDTPSVGSVKSFAMSTQGTSGGTTTGSVEISGSFTAGTTYYLNVWHYTSTIEYFYDATFTITGTVQTYTVSYDGNAKSGASVSSVPSSQTKDYGTNLTLSSTTPTSTSPTSTFTVTYNANSGSTTKASETVTKTQPYTFNNWNTAAGGGGTSYASGGTYSANAAATLYAQWTAGTATYTKVTMPTTSQCTRTGYDLLGFSTSSSATTATYSPGTQYTITSATTLYAVWKKKTYAVSYNANGGSGAPSAQTKTYGETLTLSSTRPTRSNGTGSNRTVTYNGNSGTAGRASDTVTPVRTYTFSKWNTQSGGGGTDYSPGGSYTANAAATLYAQWSHSDNNPTVTLPSASRTGYTLLGWATSSGATTAQYAAGASYAVSATVTLYAVWQINTYAVTYNANGGSGAPSAQTKTYNVALTLSATVPTRTGYSFQGWGTSSGATTASYQPGGSYTSNAAITLYAVWKKLTYPVDYDANGGTGAPASQTKTYGETLKLSSVTPTRETVLGDTYTVTYNANGGSCGTASATARRRTVYTFQKWNTTSGGTGTSYNAGANYTANASATLYARWKAEAGTEAVTLPPATRSGYKFLGWSTNQAATAAQYTAGDSYAPPGNVTLYAVWQAQGLAEIAEGSNFGEYQIYIANGSGWDPYQAYAANGSGWDPYV